MIELLLELLKLNDLDLRKMSQGMRKPKLQCFFFSLSLSLSQMYHFKLLSVTLTKTEGHSQWKADCDGLNFWHTSQLIWIKFDVVFKQFQLNVVASFKSEKLFDQGK